MLAPSHRGIGSVGNPVHRSVSSKTSVSFKTTVADRLRRAALLAVLGLVAAQVGCDDAQNAADKRVNQDVNTAVDAQKYSTAKDASVASALSSAGEKGQVVGAAKAAESLPVLDSVKSREEGDALAAWRTEETKLTARQRGAIAAAIRTAAQEDRKAVRAALATIVEKNPSSADKSSRNGTSPETLIGPILRQADLEAAAGDALTRQALERDVEIGSVIADVQQLIGQLRLLTADIDSQIAKSPTSAIEHVDQLKTKIEGTDDKADWIGTADAAIPTATKFKAQKAALEADIAKLKADKTDAESKVKGLRAEAAKTKAEADTQKGDLALNLAKDAAQKEFDATILIIGDAAKSIVGIDALDSQIAAKEGELSVLESRAPAMGVAQSLLDTRRKTLSDNWLSTREQVSNLAAEVAKLVGPAAGPATGPSAVEPVTLSPLTITNNPKAAATQPINPANAYARLSAESVITAKLARIKALSDDAKQIRDEAGDLYQLALSHVAAAAKEAEKASGNVKAQQELASPGAVERAPLKGRLDFLNAKQFDFASAAIRAKLGRLGGDKVISLMARSDLRAFIQTNIEKNIGPSFQAADEALVKVSEITKESPAWEKGKLQKAAAFDVLSAAIADLPMDQDILGKPGVKDADGKDDRGELGKADGHYNLADGLLNQVLDKVDASGDKGSADASDSGGSVSADELLTNIGQTKRASLGLSANMLYSRAQLLKAAGDAKGYDQNLKVAISRTKEYRRNYGDRVPAPAMPPGAPPEMYTILNISTTRPSIRPDTQPTTIPTTPETPGTPSTNPADAGNGGIFGQPPTPSGAGTSAPIPPVSEWTEHTVPNSTVTFRAPPTWTKVDPLPQGLAYAVIAGAGDPTNLNIVLTPNVERTKLDDALAKQVSDDAAKAVEGYGAISAKVIDFAGSPALELVGTQEIQGFHFKRLQIAVPSGKQIVTMTFTTNQSTYDKLEPTFRQMATSLKTQ